MKIRTLLILFFFSSLMVLAGCQAGNIQSAGTVQPGATPGSGIPGTGFEQTLVAPEETLTPELQNLVTRAREMLSQKYQLKPEQFSLFAVTPANWPDSSLGCPQPGVLYQPVVTPGYQMVFEGGGRTYIIHTGQSDLVVLCTARPPDEIYPTP